MSDLKPRIDGLSSEVNAQLNSLLEQAYQRGAEDMRTLILNAAGNASPVEQKKLPARKTKKRTKTKTKLKTKKVAAKKAKKRKSVLKKRAPQGSVEAALRKALTRKPGSTVGELQKALPQIDRRISMHSIAPTLQRLQGKKFSNNKGKWSIKK